MKTIKIIFAFVFSSLLLTGCDSDFQEVNTNPNDPSVVPSSLLLAGVIRSTADRLQDTFLAGEAGSEWSQHLSKVVYNDADYYIPRQNSIQTLWDVLYGSVLKDADVMEKLALEEGNSDMQGVALVLKAYAFQVLTDSFGDIPMSEALQGDTTGNFTPVYDRQSRVYNSIIDMLTQADNLLNGTGSIDSSQDILYGGDSSKWKMFANSLKFRAIMRASGNSGYVVGNQLQSLVSKVFTSNNNEAVMTYLSARPNANPLFEGPVFGGRIAEWCMGKELVDFMMSNSDPRLPVYAQEVGGNGSGNGYVGKPAGIRNLATSPYNSTNVSWIGEKFLLPEAPAYFMTNSQLKFLMAEAAERNFITGSAATYYSEAINASFDFHGVSAGGYDMSYPGGAAGLQKIAEQEWVSLYMQGYEAWAEQRRTGFPVLPLAIDADVSSIPSRFNYPGNEQSINAANYSSAVSSQGPDLLTTSLWWQN